jgi:hypothetical protein
MASVCLICCEDFEEVTYAKEHFLYRDRRALKTVFYEIFYHLLIPNEVVPDLYRLCKDERFCPRCLQTVEDVSRMLSKISTLKLLVQNKVESLGHLIASSPIPKLKQNGPTTSKRWKTDRSLWNKLRNPVIQSNLLIPSIPQPNFPVIKCIKETIILITNLTIDFARDLLPLPRVILKDCSSTSKPQSKDVTSSKLSNTQQVEVDTNATPNTVLTVPNEGLSVSVKLRLAISYL